jgi:hypothetical protein
MQAALDALFQVAGEILRPQRPTGAGCFTESLRHGFLGNAGPKDLLPAPGSVVLLPSRESSAERASGAEPAVRRRARPIVVSFGSKSVFAYTVPGLPGVYRGFTGFTGFTGVYRVSGFRFIGLPKHID